MFFVLFVVRFRNVWGRYTSIEMESFQFVPYNVFVCAPLQHAERNRGCELSKPSLACIPLPHY